MAEIVQHNLLEPEKYYAVAADWQPREAKHATTYDDGTTATTIHMLYLEEGEVRSCPIDDWPPAK